MKGLSPNPGGEVVPLSLSHSLSLSLSHHADTHIRTPTIHPDYFIPCMHPAIGTPYGVQQKYDFTLFCSLLRLSLSYGTNPHCIEPTT